MQKWTSKDEHSGPLIHDSQKLLTVANNYFASRGAILAAKLPYSERYFRSILNIFVKKLFYFAPVTPAEMESEILLLPIGKSDGAYSCPTIILKVAKRLISIPLLEIMYASILEGAYPNKLKLIMTRAVPIFKSGDYSDPNNYRPISPSFLQEFLKKACKNVWSRFWGRWSFLWVTVLL